MLPQMPVMRTGSRCFVITLLQTMALKVGMELDVVQVRAVDAVRRCSSKTEVLDSRRNDHSQRYGQVAIFEIGRKETVFIGFLNEHACDILSRFALCSGEIHPHQVTSCPLAGSGACSYLC